MTRLAAAASIWKNLAEKGTRVMHISKHLICSRSKHSPSSRPSLVLSECSSSPGSFSNSLAVATCPLSPWRLQISWIPCGWILLRLMYAAGELSMLGGAPLAGFLLDITKPDISYLLVMLTAEGTLVLGVVSVTSWFLFNQRAR